MKHIIIKTNRIDFKKINKLNNLGYQVTIVLK